MALASGAVDPGPIHRPGARHSASARPVAAGLRQGGSDANQSSGPSLHSHLHTHTYALHHIRPPPTRALLPFHLLSALQLLTPQSPSTPPPPPPCLLCLLNPCPCPLPPLRGRDQRSHPPITQSLHAPPSNPHPRLLVFTLTCETLPSLTHDRSPPWPPKLPRKRSSGRLPCAST